MIVEDTFHNIGSCVLVTDTGKLLAFLPLVIEKERKFGLLIKIKRVNMCDYFWLGTSMSCIVLIWIGRNV